MLLMSGLLAVAGVLPPLLLEPHYTLPATTIDATVRADGTVHVVEHHTFAFTDRGRGAHVDIPRAPGTAVGELMVSEGGRRYAYRTGEPEADGPAGTYAEGACADDGPHRVVWNFTAEPGTTRTFRLAYTLKKAVTVHDRHAFLHLPVRAKHWQRGVDRLDVTVRLPRPAGQVRGVYEAFGRPSGHLAATVGDGVTATARAVPGVHSLALDVVFPREQLTLPVDGRHVRVGSGGDGAAGLAALRTGRSLVNAEAGTDCRPLDTGVGADLTRWVFGGMAVLVVATITLLSIRAAVPHHPRGGHGRVGDDSPAPALNADPPGGS